MQTKFLDYKSFLINPGATQAAIRAEFRSHLIAAGWQVTDDAANERLFTRPPATEAIGNNLGEEWVRLTFEAARLTLGMSYKAATERPRIIDVRLGTGTNNYGLKLIIGGTTLAGAASAVDATRNQNFLTALTASTDPEVSKYAYAMRADSSGPYLECAEKVVGTGGTIVDSSAGAFYASTVVLRDTGNTAGEFLHGSTTMDAVTYDRAGGFVYHLSLRARSVGIGIETTSAYSGPVWGTYIPHDVALASEMPGQPLVELAHILFTASQPSGLSSSVGGYFMNYGVFQGLPVNSGSSAVGALGMNQSIRQVSTAISTGIIAFYNRTGEQPGSWNLMTSSVDVLGTNDVPMVAAGLLSSPIILRGGSSGGTSNSATIYPRFLYQPHAMVDDLLVFHGVANNESLHLLTQAYAGSTLVAPIDATAATLPLVSTAGFATAGTAVLGSEIVSYTGKTANSLTGVTRGVSSAAVPAAAGLPVYPGEWFVKINRGLLPCGPLKPA